MTKTKPSLTKAARAMDPPPAGVPSAPNGTLLNGAHAPPAAGELSHTPMPDELQMVRLASITPSPSNPRKHFPEQALQDLAASIRAKGVLQPVLLRPHPLAVAPLKYELVAGERRVRAAVIAGLQVVPAIIRNLDDRSVLEIQVVENEQREDVTPLEKCEGYARLIDVHHATAEQIAAKVGKSVSTIRGILKLRQLPEKARKALEAGDLEASVAGLVARVPGESSRAEVAKYATTKEEAWRGGGLPSYRRVKEVISQRYMVELKAAPFDRKCLNLLPEAGSCDACPKRTGNDREQFPDARADVCTDVDCYHLKTKAWQANTLRDAKVAGLKVLTKTECEKVFPYSHNASLPYGSEYMDLAETVEEDKKRRTLEKIAGEDLAGDVVLATDPKGNLRRLVPKAKAAKALKDRGVGVSSGRGGGSTSASEKRWKAEQAEARRKQLMQKEVARRCMGLVAEGAAGRSLSILSSLHLNDTVGAPVELLRVCATGLVDNIWDDASREVVKRRGLLPPKGDRNGGNRDILESLIRNLKPAECLALMAELIAAKRLIGFGSERKETDEFLRFFGVDRKPIAAEVKAEFAAKSKGKAKKPKGKKTAESPLLADLVGADRCEITVGDDPACLDCEQVADSYDDAGRCPECASDHAKGLDGDDEDDD